MRLRIKIALLLTSIILTCMGPMLFELCYLGNADYRAMQMKKATDERVGRHRRDAFSLSVRNIHSTDAEQEEVFDAARPPLPIFWINMEKSIDRRQAMESMFASIAKWGDFISPVRILAIDTNEIVAMIGEQRLSFEGTVKLVPRDDEPVHMKHNRNEYIYEEAACMLSHLTAILQAYNNGHDEVLIMEDDQVLTTEFLLNWRAYASLAPPDWAALQWTTSREPLLKQGRNLHDPWISWQPDHYSTGTYMLNRKGMLRIIEKTWAGGPPSLGDESHSWRILEPDMVVSDEVIYFLASDTYTSTHPWVGHTRHKSILGHSNHLPLPLLKEVESTFGTAKSSSQQAALPQMEYPLRPEKILVLSNLRMTSKDAISIELERLRVDVAVLSMWHANTKWVLNVVLTDPTSPFHLDESLSATPRLPEWVDLRVKVDLMTFNKFTFLKNMLAEIATYDYVLFKDNDQRLAGFPWNSFLEERGDALVSGPLRESRSESLTRVRINVKGKRHQYQFRDGKEWKGAESSTEALFVSVKPFPFPFIEMFFVLMQSDYAKWFFSQLLTDAFISQPSSWGPDSMWCAAANDFDSNKTACNLVPLISLHEDTRHIVEISPKQDEELFRKRETLQHFNENPTFARWMRKHEQWIKIIGRKATYKTIKGKMRAAKEALQDTEEPIA
jgi:GR25 family glycosyltransferase involved in LPS biosynthesis